MRERGEGSRWMKPKLTSNLAGQTPTLQPGGARHPPTPPPQGCKAVRVRKAVCQQLLHCRPRLATSHRPHSW